MPTQPSPLLERSTKAARAAVEESRCPTCEQPIAYEQAEEIRRRIEEKESQAAAAVEERVRREREVAHREATEAATKAMEERLAEADQKRTAAEAAVEALKADHESELATARREATEAATKAMEERLAEADQKRTAAEAAVEALKADHESELATARREATEAATKAMEERLAEADQKRTAAEAAVEALKAAHEHDVVERVAEVREACDADKLQAINQEKAAAFEERQKLEEELARVTRKLQRKTSDELGEGAEVDLFEALKSAFPDDKIRRVAKGEPGADIIHEVFEDGVKCGTIVYDSKNRARWLNDYVDKLRRDQLAEKADHAVLTAGKFPSGASQLHLQDGVIVTNPARALVVAQILRRHVAVVSSLRLSNEGRDEKMTKLYGFITSEQCSQEIEQLETVSERLLDLDVQEKKAHDKVWKDRGALVRQSQRTLAELTTEIDRIVGQPDAAAATA